MNILTSSLSLEASHRHTQTFTRQESLQAWVGSPGARPAPAGAAAPGRQAGPDGAPVAWSPRAQLALAQPQPPARRNEQAAPASPTSTRETTSATEAAEALSEADPRLLTLARMIEALTGQPVRLRAWAPGSADPATPPAASAAPAAPGAGVGLVYERRETRVQTETLQVQAQGVVQTADGQTLQISLSLRLSHTQIDERLERLSFGAAVAMKDPLVIHFDGPVGALSDVRFDFDLDADGQNDALPFVGSGSGFVALDRNGNGQIDTGRELFGAQSGDGFADLAALDDDGNGWIDATDAVFDRLQVWRLGADAVPRLQGLADAGVGALYLGRAAGDFALRDAQQAELGRVRATGLYLNTQGQAGVLQQVDLVA